MPPAYPGQRPYPGSGGAIPGIPGSSRKSTGPNPNNQGNMPMPNFRGLLTRMDSKSITISLEDQRELDFKRTDKTKFFKNGEEAKPADFKEGDQISVEGPQDATGYLTAVNVYWEKAAASTSTAGAKDKEANDVPDTWAGDAEAPRGGTELKPPPAQPDADDPGRPVLRRGKPADAAREESKPVPDQPPPAATADARAASAGESPGPAAPPPVRPAARSDEDLPFESRRLDPLIRKATDAALDFTETLPNYVCQEMIARSQSETRPADWQALDIVSAEVVFENGKEDYRNVAINGKPTKKKIEETGGSWSTGEFGTMLIDLFSPATAAEFRYVRDSRQSGVAAKEYAFDVMRANSHWTVQIASQTYRPAYSGSVWIDPATSRVLRIEMQAQGFPGDFPTDHVESATDYEYTRLGDTRQYLLPVHAETLSCQRGSNICSRNVIDFRNYHKFEGESTIQYGAPK
jgi:hypothetical protein